MQSNHDGSGSFGGFQVASLESVHHGSSPTHDSQIASAVARAVQPAVAAAVAAQIQSSLREPWFADIIRASVREFLSSSPSASGSSQSNLSQSSLSSSGSAASGSMVQSMPAEGSCHGAAVAVEANLLWDVPCPVCSKVSLNENAFVEHIKLIAINRHQGFNPKIKCVLRENNDRHVRLLRRWSLNQCWQDSACDFVTALRSHCNPGHKKVYVPGGTGNNKKVKKFVLECLHYADVQHTAGHAGHARGSSDVGDDGNAPGSPDWSFFDQPPE